MQEIYIHNSYEVGELEGLLNPHVGNKLDGVIMYWDHAASLIIVRLHNASIEDIMSHIQDTLGNDVKLSLNPDY